MQRWTEKDKEKLREIYSRTQPCDTSSEFLEKIHKEFEKDRSIGSVQEMSRRLGLKPKKIRSDKCKHCGCELVSGNRISDACKKCYHASYYTAQLKPRRG